MTVSCLVATYSPSPSLLLLQSMFNSYCQITSEELLSMANLILIHYIPDIFPENTVLNLYHNGSSVLCFQLCIACQD